MQLPETWTETYVRLLKADQEHALKPDELETYALAAYLIGKDGESFQVLERAHQGNLDEKKIEKAVRCSFWLGMMLVNTGERARGGGWLAKGERLLIDGKTPDCAEKGLFLIPKALGLLSVGDAAKARDLFEQAENIGEQFGDSDLIVLGRLGHGQAKIQQGEVAKGIKLLDETMITLETENIFPLAKGIIYCAAVETCRKAWDLERAREWTLALTRWCDNQPDIVPFRGQCLVRKAEILKFHGEWAEALEETERACKLLTRPPGEPAAGEAYTLKGDLNRLLGNFKEAEDGYHQAAKWGKNPQPGLALLRLAQGQAGAGDTSIKNILDETKDDKRRGELLPAAVRILLAREKIEEAAQASHELCEIANAFDAPYLLGIAAYYKTALCLAEGKFQSALEHLQLGLKHFGRYQLPYETARTKELKGMVYRKLGDRDNADAALDAAQWIFEQLGAVPDLERIDRILNGKRQHETHGLTLRELQVLQNVASGKTNKSIACELFISERTVDRHVSNIFNKLGVSSRVEAATFALKNNMLDDGH